MSRYPGGWAGPPIPSFNHIESVAKFETKGAVQNKLSLRSLLLALDLDRPSDSICNLETHFIIEPKRSLRFLEYRFQGIFK